MRARSRISCFPPVAELVDALRRVKRKVKILAKSRPSFVGSHSLVEMPCRFESCRGDLQRRNTMQTSRAEKRKIIIKILQAAIKNHVSSMSFDAAMYRINPSLHVLWWWSAEKLEQLRKEIESKRYDASSLPKFKTEEYFQTGLRTRLNEIQKEELSQSQLSLMEAKDE